MVTGRHSLYRHALDRNFASEKAGVLFIQRCIGILGKLSMQFTIGYARQSMRGMKLLRISRLGDTLE